MKESDVHQRWVEQSFLLSTLFAAVLTVNLSNLYILGGLIVLIGFGLVGFKDDFGKVLAGDNLEGLTPRGKMGLQVIIAILATGTTALCRISHRVLCTFFQNTPF